MFHCDKPLCLSQLFTVDKQDLMEKTGTLAISRINEIIDGIKLVLLPR